MDKNHKNKQLHSEIYYWKIMKNLGSINLNVY